MISGQYTKGDKDVRRVALGGSTGGANDWAREGEGVKMPNWRRERLRWAATRRKKHSGQRRLWKGP